jgi:uncharacterized membrane protein YfcA
VNVAVIAVAGLIAGAINSIAGGGTLISFPALLWIGRNPIIANATNTVAIWPGSFAGVIGFRKHIAELPRWLFYLTIPALVGGIAGAVLLLHTSEKTFSKLIPLLILGATLLLAAQEVITRRLTILKRLHDEHAGAFGVFAFVFQFFVSVYGGYFGAGMGILMLASLGLIGMNDMLKMNGLKNLLAICINGVAAVYFMVLGKVVWSDVAVMAVASIVGGFLGARLAVRLGKKFVRAAVVVIGLVMTVLTFVKK